MMQDDAGKTPEAPRWHRAGYANYRVCRCTDGHHREFTKAEEIAADLNHLEGTLREAEQDRDSAIDVLTTTQADWTEERQQFADEVSAYQIKLREAETLAAQMQEKWHRSEMLILEDADDLDLLREEAAEALWMAEMLANMPAYEAEADRAAWSLTMVAVMKQPPWFVDALQQPKAGA